MSVQESLKILTYEQEGILRYIKCRKYISAAENRAIGDTMALIERLRERALRIEAEIQEEYIRGYERGYEEGKNEFATSFSTLIEELSIRSQRQLEVERDQFQRLFQDFLSRLATILPAKSLFFVEEYIKRFLDEYSSSGRLQVIVSEEVFKLLKEGGSNLFECVEIVANPDLKPEQIFIQHNGALSEAGIDRFFEELSR